MAFHDKPDESFAQLRRLAQKLLGSSQDGGLIAADFNLRDGLDCHGNALPGVEILLRRNVEAHQLQTQLAAAFHHGEDHRAVSLDHARAAESIHDQGLIGAGLAIHPRQDTHDKN